MGNIATLNMGAHDQQHAAMRVYVIYSALWIIFGYKYSAVLPHWTVRQKLDHLAQGKIVIGDIRLAQRISIGRPRVCSMVVAQTDDGQRRQRLCLEPLGEVLVKFLVAKNVRNSHVRGRRRPVG